MLLNRFTTINLINCLKHICNYYLGTHKEPSGKDEYTVCARCETYRYEIFYNCIHMCAINNLVLMSIFSVVLPELITVGNFFFVYCDQVLERNLTNKSLFF
jgi:hypothetical protein